MVHELLGAVWSEAHAPREVHAPLWAREVDAFLEPHAVRSWQVLRLCYRHDPPACGHRVGCQACVRVGSTQPLHRLPRPYRLHDYGDRRLAHPAVLTDHFGLRWLSC